MRTLNKVNPTYSLQAIANILLAAAAEKKTLNLNNGNVAHGFEIRIRNRLMKEGGADYNEALYLVRGLRAA